MVQTYKARVMSLGKIKSYLSYAQGLSWSFVHSAKYRSALTEAERFVLFIGFARSGSTIVGALLNAHPDAVISIELNTLKYMKMKASRQQLLALTVRQDHKFQTSGNVWTGYDYSVPNTWQGRYRKLRVFGDKKAAETTRLLAENTGLLDRTIMKMGVPVSVVHVVRDPYDTIATQAKRSGISLEASASRYFDRCVIVDQVRAQLSKQQLIEFRHEDLIEKPKETLRYLVNRLGLDDDESYIDACASIINPKANKSRETFEWPKNLKEKVTCQIRQFEFLEEYSQYH